TIDDGPDPDVTPGVLEILHKHSVSASFFCIGERVAAHPDLCRAIVAGGHTIENHSHRHSHCFSLLGLRGIRQEIQTAQEVIASITGRSPCFFRAPAGLRSVLLYPVLHRLGMRQVSWTRRGYDTRIHNASVVYKRLTRGLAAGDILLLHDGHAARTSNNAPVIIEVLPQLLETIAARGLRATNLQTALGDASVHS
ncbi:MAG TPA: polysaccharide deacetylase family protein, partial [Rhodocyclaceae bacterium]|nr:polysaccharide deacetylase family protein [Rhodocyclaceae bacterium]